MATKDASPAGSPTEKPAAAAATESGAGAKAEAADKPRNAIQISLRFPVFRFVTATRNLLAEGQETVELSAIGNAITSVVSVAEILKKQNLVEVTKIETSLIEIQGRNERNATVAKLLVVVKKSAQFDELEKQRQEAEAKAKAEADAAGDAGKKKEEEESK